MGDNASQIKTPLENEVQSALLVAIQENADRAAAEPGSGLPDEAESYARAACSLAGALAHLRG